MLRPNKKHKKNKETVSLLLCAMPSMISNNSHKTGTELAVAIPQTSLDSKRDVACNLE